MKEHIKKLILEGKDLEDLYLYYGKNFDLELIIEKGKYLWILYEYNIDEFEKELLKLTIERNEDLDVLCEYI
jgi:flagellar assembly factor FliW